MSLPPSLLTAFGIDDSPAHAVLAEALRTAFCAVDYARNTTWHAAGKPCLRLLFVTEGQLAHTYPKDGKSVTRWVTLSGDFETSLASFIWGMPSDEDITCITPVRGHEISRDAFLSLRDTYPAVQAFWVLALERLVAGYEERIRQLITTKAEERYERFVETHPRRLLEVPQKHLAAMIGVEPRHLSRIRARKAGKSK